MTLYRGTVAAYDLVTHTATVRLDGSAPQTLDGVRIAPHLFPQEFFAGRRVLLDSGESGEFAELVIYSTLSGGGPSVLTVNDLVGAKGDLIAGDAFGGAQTLPAGADYLALTARNLAPSSLGLEWRAPGDIARLTATVDVVSSSGENTLWAPTLPGGLLGTERAVRLVLIGDYLNNSGAARTLRLRIKYGSTTLWDDTSSSIAASATRRPLLFDLVLGNRASASSQQLGGHVVLGVDGATSGLGDFGSAALAASMAALTGTSSVNSASDQALTITVQHSASNASLSVRALYGAVALL